MSNFGDQTGLPTDRPPDTRSTDGFPKTKSILWDKKGVGKPTYLHLGYFRKPRVCIPEKILKLVQHQCENYGQKNHTLIGTLVVEDDGEGVQFQVDRLDTRAILSADVSANLAPGDMLIPLEVTNNTAGKRRGSVEDFLVALKRLQERCCNKSSIDLSSFVLLRGWVSFYSNVHSSVAHMDIDMVTMGTVFKATPIANVPIVLTALSKNLAGPMSLSQTQGIPKSGYLTMDHTRKLLLVLESDPKAGTLPIVGIWVSGVDFVQHSFVWAACLRYIHNTHLQDRVCAPPEEFLLVLYSPLHSRPEFFQCTTTTGESKLLYELWCGHEVSNHTKSLSSQSDDFTEVELEPEQNGEEKALFDAAQAKHRTMVSKGHLEKSMTEDINPRSIPTPHAASLPVMKPMVPDVSILWTDSPNNSSLSSSGAATFQPAHIARQAPSVDNRLPLPVMTASHPPSVQPSPPYSIPQLRSHAPSKSQSNGPQFSSASSREAVQFSQPYIYPVQDQSKLQNFAMPFMTTPTSLNASQNSPLNYQRHPPSFQNNNSNRHVLPVYQNVYDQHTPVCDTQNKVVFHTPYPLSNHQPQTSCSVNNNVCMEMHQSLQHTQTTTSGTYGHRSHNNVVLSSQGNNTNLTTENSIGPHNHQYTAAKQRPCQFTAESRPEHLTHQAIAASRGPQWEYNCASGQSSSYIGPVSQMPTNVTPYNSCPHNAPQVTVSKNHFPPVSTLKTVVEESSSSSSSTCGGCKCHAGKNNSTNKEDSIARSSGTNASVNGSNHDNAGNITKSSDDDSGLSVTPERPSSTPPPVAIGSEPSSSNASLEKNTNSLGQAMSNVNWDQVPPEIRSLLIQQNEQLKLLQQQIQMLMLNQSQKSLAAGGDLASASLSVPSSDSRTCSVAVNTSFTQDHCSVVESQLARPDRCSPQRSHSSGQLSSDGLQNQECREDISFQETGPKGPVLMHSTSYNALDERVNPLENCATTNRLPGPQYHTELEKSEVTRSSFSLPPEVAKNSRASVSGAEVSEFDLNRSHFDPSFPNDSEFSNCQDESYSTVAEEATDPRQFYDQIMNNIHLFLTNGEDNNDTQPDKEEEQTSLSLHDSDTKLPDSANSTLLPHLNYISMMFGASSDTGQSMEINAMAMKYLKDDQLTQMALMLKQSDGSDSKTTSKLLQRMITTGSGKKSLSEVSQLGLSPNNLTMGTRNYLEKHGLLGDESQCFNDYSVFDHTLKLKTDFSVAMTDKDSEKSLGPFISRDSSPMKTYGRRELGQIQMNQASLSPLADPKDNRLQQNNINGKTFPKDLGASPVLMPPKQYNLTRPPLYQDRDRNPQKNRGVILDNSAQDEHGDNENILDIAKLKQLPKLL